MKTLFSAILLLFLSTQLFGKDNYSLDFYNIDRYNQSIPTISLAVTPQNKYGLKFILSYVSTLFSFKKTVKPTEYAQDEEYNNLQLTMTYRF